MPNSSAHARRRAQAARAIEATRDKTAGSVSGASVRRLSIVGGVLSMPLEKVGCRQLFAVI